MKLSRALQMIRHSPTAIVTTISYFDEKEAAFANGYITWEADAPAPQLESRLQTGLTLVSGGLDGERYLGISPTQMDTLRKRAASLKIPLLIATEMGDYTLQQPIAAIILAAGEATRFGSPKQLLDYHGQPFVRQIAQTALSTGLAPVIVVSGAHAELVEKALQDLPVTVIRNKNWQNGQGSSISAGVASIAGTGSGAVMLFVADQPQVTVHVIGALMARYAAEGGAIVAPLAADRRTHPFLFDHECIADLLALTGDVSGRAIFSNYKVDYIPWHDESLSFDVDTPADYRKLLAWGVKD